MKIDYCYNKNTEEIFPITTDQEDVNVQYYLNLLETGHSYQELDKKLQELFLYHCNIPGHKSYLDGILAQRNYLSIAGSKYLSNMSINRNLKQKKRS